jgi:hypothetical protein
LAGEHFGKAEHPGWLSRPVAEWLARLEAKLGVRTAGDAVARELRESL